MNGDDAMGGDMGDRRDSAGAAFASKVRETFAVAPSEDISRRHLAAIVAAARDTVQSPSEAPDRRTPPRRMRLRLRAVRWAASGLAAAITASAVAAGLSFAGVVTLPEPARRVYSTFGITLPDGNPEEPRTTTEPAGSTTPLTEARPEGKPSKSPHGKPDQADSADERPRKGADDAAKTEPSQAASPDVPGDHAGGNGQRGDADDSDGGGDAEEGTPPPEGDSAP